MIMQEIRGPRESFCGGSKCTLILIFIISAVVVRCGAEDVGVIDIRTLKRTVSSLNFESKK